MIVLSYLGAVLLYVADLEFNLCFTMSSLIDLDLSQTADFSDELPASMNRYPGIEGSFQKHRCETLGWYSIPILGLQMAKDHEADGDQLLSRSRKF